MARPESEPKTPLAARIREVRRLLGIEDRGQFAKALGVSKTMLAQYERGESEPTASKLGRYREVHGVSLEWLLTGEGPVFADATKAPNAPVRVDPDLIERLYKLAQRVHADASIKPPAHMLAVEATALYNQLLARVTSLDDTAIVEAVIPVLEDELRARLAQAEAEPGTGKQSA
jgi:transcriptional regulator with XRE-family HTH domain